VIKQTNIRVRSARAQYDTALASLDAFAWSAESRFPSVIQRAHGDNGTFFNVDNPPEAFLVAELDGSVVGYIRLRPPTRLPENAHVIQVQGLAVHPAARGRGIAAMLLTEAERRLRQRGTQKLTLRVLSTNVTAISLYERLGFTHEGALRQEFIINGSYVDDILMAKLL